MPKLICFEINEINFPDVEKYIKDGKLKNFARLINEYGYSTTISESDQGVLNPWVQWVTAHTGLEYADHGIKRLGDAQNANFDQIWESIESLGFKVGAFYPFNSKNKLKSASFFTPDPWVDTPIDAPYSVKLIHQALKQITSDYAKDKIALSSYLKLGFGMLPYMQLRHIPQYANFTYHYLKGRKWYRALLCDLLLSDVFVKLYKKNRPDFATVCINAGAHVQHHYAFSSVHYEGEIKNPEWYVPANFDPVEQVYELYDQLIGEWLEAMPQDTRAMFITGLSQEAHDRMSIYYRLDDHEAFLQEIGLQYKKVQPLMTEDFILWFDTNEQAKAAQVLLDGVVAEGHDDLFYVQSADDNERSDATTASLFYVDNRGKDLYIQLRPCNRKYPENFTIKSGDTRIKKFEDKVSFVSIKNSGHRSEGYFIDTNQTKEHQSKTILLKDVFHKIRAVFDTRAEA